MSPSAISDSFELQPSFSRTDIMYIRLHFFTVFFLGKSRITKELDFFVPAGINY